MVDLLAALTVASSGMAPRAQTGDHRHFVRPHATHLGVEVGKVVAT